MPGEAFHSRTRSMPPPSNAWSAMQGPLPTQPGMESRSSRSTGASRVMTATGSRSRGETVRLATRRTCGVPHLPTTMQRGRSSTAQLPDGGCSTGTARTVRPATDPMPVSPATPRCDRARTRPCGACAPTDLQLRTTRRAVAPATSRAPASAATRRPSRCRTVAPGRSSTGPLRAASPLSTVRSVMVPTIVRRATDETAARVRRSGAWGWRDEAQSSGQESLPCMLTSPLMW